VTPDTFRAQGSSYPRALRPPVLARAIAEIERFLPAGPAPLVPFEDTEEVPIGYRFPSPRGLLHVAKHGVFELTLPGIEAAFFGDLDTTFDYPWVTEFGAVALLDPLSLSAYRVPVRPGWFVCDGAQIVPEKSALFVPRREMAEKIEAAHAAQGRVLSRDEAVEAVGRVDLVEATAIAVTRCRAYVDALPVIDARARELKAQLSRHPEGIRAELARHGLRIEDLDRPTFQLPPPQRRALADLAL
jgi:hypothetical protein